MAKVTCLCSSRSAPSLPRLACQSDNENILFPPGIVQAKSAVELLKLIPLQQTEDLDRSPVKEAMTSSFFRPVRPAISNCSASSRSLARVNLSSICARFGNVTPFRITMTYQSKAALPAISGRAAALVHQTSQRHGKSLSLYSESIRLSMGERP